MKTIFKVQPTQCLDSSNYYSPFHVPILLNHPCQYPNCIFLAGPYMLNFYSPTTYGISWHRLDWERLMEIKVLSLVEIHCWQIFKLLAKGVSSTLISYFSLDRLESFLKENLGLEQKHLSRMLPHPGLAQRGRRKKKKQFCSAFRLLIDWIHQLEKQDQ